MSFVLYKSARGKAAEPASYYTNPIWEEIRDHQHVLDGVSAYASQPFDIGRGGEVQRVSGIFVSGRFFDVVGARPWIGRTFTDDDDRRGGGSDGPTAVLGMPSGAIGTARRRGRSAAHCASRQRVHGRRSGPAGLLRPGGGQFVRCRRPSRHRAAHPRPGEQPAGCARRLVAQYRRSPRAGADAWTRRAPVCARCSRRSARRRCRTSLRSANISPIRWVCRRRRLASPGCGRTIGPRSSS